MSINIEAFRKGKDLMEASPDGRPIMLPFNYDCPAWQENRYGETTGGRKANL